MDKYSITIEPVEHDDHGDTQYKWYAHIRKGDVQYWYDYYSEKPALEDILSGALGES